MIELTEREKKIALIKYIIHGVSPYSKASLDQRVQMLIAALNICGIKYDETEMLDIGESVLSFQQETNDFIAGFVRDNGMMIEMAKSTGDDSIAELFKQHNSLIKHTISQLKKIRK